MTTHDTAPTHETQPAETDAAILGAGALLGAEVVRENRGPRKAVMHNGEITVGGDEHYATPDPEVMAAIEQETGGKVAYFPSREIPDDSGGKGQPNFNHAVLTPLYEEITQRYPDRRLALRSIMASVNGTREGAFNGQDVRDITETVELGSEQSTASFNVQELPADEDPITAAQKLKYISKYATDVGKNVDWEVEDPNDRDAIFPAIVVYDADALEPTGEDRFTVQIKDGVQPSVAVVATYVLDRTE